MLTRAMDLNLEIGQELTPLAVRRVQAIMPALSIEAIPNTEPFIQLRSWSLGNGALSEVDGCGHGQVRQAPQRTASPSLGLLIATKGSFEISQCGVHLSFSAGGGCVIDNRFDYELWCTPSSMLLLELPREMVVSRNPQVNRKGPMLVDCSEPGMAIFRETVIKATSLVHQLDHAQRLILSSSLVRMWGLPSVVGDKDDWRTKRALSFILANLGDPQMTAATVAKNQSISRRSLDELFVRVVGRPVTAEIYEQRLTHAYDFLADLSQQSRSISEIAYSVGFSHPAHFSRAFSRRFGMSPTQRRLQTLHDHGV